MTANGRDEPAAQGALGPHLDNCPVCGNRIPCEKKTCGKELAEHLCALVNPHYPLLDSYRYKI